MATSDDRANCPFLLKLFYRTGAFHRPDEFVSDDSLPYLPVYTFSSCTLHELVYHMAAADRPLLPSPSVGTRVAFRLVYADTRSALDSSDGSYGGGPSGPRYVVKDLGSVVIGHRTGEADQNQDGQDGQDDMYMVDAGDEPDDDGYKTLSEARYVVGDYISCAILPPLPNGKVAPASDARSGRGSGIGEGRVGAMPRFGGRRDDYWNGSSGGHAGGPGGGGGARRGPSRQSGISLPVGEWRRGEMLPEEPSWGRPGGGGGSGGGGRGGRHRSRGGRW